MARNSRLVVQGELAVYHVMSRTALVGYVLGDVEKEYLIKLIQKLSRVYFVEGNWGQANNVSSPLP